MNELVRRIRSGGLAAIFTLAAGVSMLLLTRVAVIEWSDHTTLYFIAGWIFVGAAIGPLITPLKPYCEIWVWNGTGWSVGLAILGLDTVGAMPMWSIMFAALALTFWPREPEKQIPVSAIAISLIGGIVVCWLAWTQPDVPTLDTWLEGL